MKSIFKNKLIIGAIVAVLVISAVVVSILLIPKAAPAQSVLASPTPAASKKPEASPAPIVASSVKPSPVPSATAKPKEKTITENSEHPDQDAYVESYTVSDSQEPASPPIVPAEPEAEVVEEEAPPVPDEEDYVEPGGTDTGEDYEPRPEDTPEYVPETENPPPNNIDDIPDYEIDDTPGNTEGGGEPGDGIKF